MPDLPLTDTAGDTLLAVHLGGAGPVRAGDGGPAYDMPAALVVVRFELCVLLVFDRWRQRWEIPGGLREPGETPHEAAVRELAEETGIHGARLTFAGVADFDLRHPDRRESLALYRTTLHTAPGLVVNDEISAFRWWHPSEPVDETMSPLDAEIARRVYSAG